MEPARARGALLYAGGGLAKRREHSRLVRPGGDADSKVGQAAKRCCGGFRDRHGDCSGYGDQLGEGLAASGGVDQNSVEIAGRGGSGRDRLIDRQGSDLNAANQQSRQVACRLQGAGSEHGAGRRRSQQIRQVPKRPACRTDLVKARRLGGLGGCVPDCKYRQGAVVRKRDEGGHTIAACKGQGRYPGQVRRGLRDGPYREQGRDQRLKTEC